MNFAPVPKNDFEEFIGLYYRRCREHFPAIEANAGKWCLEDLIPGLSDFDTRFITADGLTATDWCAMAMEVGHVHLELVRERKEWARNLEHLPGVNLTWKEALNPERYHTEFSQWSFYQGPLDRLNDVRRLLSQHSWNHADEGYHWNRLAYFYGPYNRTIDPPINLGCYENKYSLHSRLLHYFAPAVHSAVCLLRRETTPGKLDAFRRAVHLFPNPATIECVLDVVSHHYEKPHFLEEPGVTELDREMESYLREAVNVLLDSNPSIQCPRNPTVQTLQSVIRAIEGPPSFAQLFEKVRFARLMKGRLWFYAQSVEWFDSLPLIPFELNRIRKAFFEGLLRLYGSLRQWEKLDPEGCLTLLCEEGFSREQVRFCWRVAEEAALPCSRDQLRRKALVISEFYEPFLDMVEKISGRAQRLMSASCVKYPHGEEDHRACQPCPV